MYSIEIVKECCCTVAAMSPDDKFTYRSQHLGFNSEDTKAFYSKASMYIIARAGNKSDYIAASFFCS